MIQVLALIAILFVVLILIIGLSVACIADAICDRDKVNLSRHNIEKHQKCINELREEINVLNRINLAVTCSQIGKKTKK